MTHPAPEGARQALATGASVLLVLTVTFVAWLTFSTDADVGPIVGLGAIDALALTAVPLLAAHPSGSLRLARWAYGVGAALSFAILVLGFAQAFGVEEEADPPDPHATVSVPAPQQA